MTSAIIAAVIGGAFTLLSTIVAHFISREWETRTLRIPQDRRMSLTGNWQGSAHQEMGDNGQPLDYTVSAKFTAKSKTIEGSVVLGIGFGDDETMQQMTFQGILIHERFLKAEYQVINEKSMIQFGFAILELSLNGRMLTGRFLSVGPVTQALVWGTMQLHKAS